MLRAGCAGGLAALGLPACSRSRGTEEAKDAAPSWPRRAVHEGVEILELFPNGADESSPIVVAVHGRGDRPDNWVEGWRSFPARVRVALPRAFDPFSDGFSWFPLMASMSDAELGVAIGGAEERLFRGLAKLAGGRRMLVTGFSQGGILSYVMAARRGGIVAKAFPVAGMCPRALLPRAGAPAAPVVAFHGTEDRVLAIEGGRAAVEGFRAHGTEAALREYPGVGHAMPPALRAELWSEIAKALPLLG